MLDPSCFHVENHGGAQCVWCIRVSGREGVAVILERGRFSRPSMSKGALI